MARRASDRRRSLTLGDLGRAGDPGSQAHYADAAYYDKTYRKRIRDVAFYVDLARSVRGPVLEYGIGSGRIAIEMARRGVEVTGIDLSRPMLARLSERLQEEIAEVRGRVRAVRGDMRRVRLGERFSLVIAPFNVWLHLYTRRDVEQFLDRVRGHLTPRGRFVFDVSIPSPDDLGADPTRRYRAPRFRDPTTGDLVEYAERFDYDPIRQILLIEMEFSPGKHSAFTVPLTHRQFFPQELEALLHYNGFRGIAFSGDFTHRPPSAETDALIVSCRAGRADPGRRVAGSQRRH